MCVLNKKTLMGTLSLYTLYLSTVQLCVGYSLFSSALTSYLLLKVFAINSFVMNLQIVMKFYGGRDISNADLERALLVGMSSHERRRLEKKRRKSLKPSKSGVVPEKEQIGSTEKRLISSTVNRLEVETVDVSFSEEDQQYANQEITDQVETEPINSGMEPEAPARDSNNQNEGLDLGDSRNDETQPMHNSKLSLLGHGPHGKQVVDHILKEYGEDGISVFCQRWRQVFVEAINPRFLPAGWDIKHRYSAKHTGYIDNVLSLQMDDLLYIDNLIFLVLICLTHFKVMLEQVFNNDFVTHLMITEYACIDHSDSTCDCGS